MPGPAPGRDAASDPHHDAASDPYHDLGTGAVPHAFVADLDDPVLDADDRHHFARVLRVRAGDTVTVADGAGSWRTCRFTPDSATVGRLEPAGAIRLQPGRRPEIAVAFALIKGERPDLVIQKLTELGVDRIIPFLAARSVVRPDAERMARQFERWHRIARGAAMQSRRATLPAIAALATVTDVQREPGVAAAARGGAPVSLRTPTIAVGPEGGWTDEELAGFPEQVGLGEHVLRAETAALAAGALLGALRSA